MVAAQLHGFVRQARWALMILACIYASGCASRPISWFERWMADDELKVASRPDHGEITTEPFLLKPTAPELGTFGPFVRIRGFWDSTVPLSVALDLSVQYGSFGGSGYHRPTKAQVIADGQRFDLRPSESMGYRPSSLLDGGSAFYFTHRQFQLLLEARNIAVRVSDENASVIGVLKENNVFVGKGEDLKSVLESAQRSHLAQQAESGARPTHEETMIRVDSIATVAPAGPVDPLLPVPVPLPVTPDATSNDVLPSETP